MTEPAATARGDAERQSTFITTRFERWALPRLAGALPRWMVPDHLTTIGIFGAMIITAGSVLSTRDLARQEPPRHGS
jgi:hypothetical protein